MEYKNNELDANNHKNIALNDIDYTIKTHIYEKDYKQAHLLSYWFEDFSKYHKEEKFLKNDFKTYKRGEIIKVNLGYNIGYELGGLHYCIVLNKRDNKSKGTLNVVPLTSKKINKKYGNFNITISNEIFNLISKNISKIENRIKNLEKINKEEENSVLKELIQEDTKLHNFLKRASLSYKKDSIVLIDQITTISKQRIFNDILTKKEKVSTETLNKIDNQIKKIFTM